MLKCENCFSQVEVTALSLTVKRDCMLMESYRLVHCRRGDGKRLESVLQVNENRQDFGDYRRRNGAGECVLLETAGRYCQQESVAALSHHQIRRYLCQSDREISRK